MHPETPPHRSAAPMPKRHQAGSYACNDGWQRGDKPHLHVVLRSSIGRLACRIECQSVIPVAQILDMGKTRDICVLHCDRLGKHFHCGHNAPPSIGISSLQGHQSTNFDRLAKCSSRFSTVVNTNGFSPVNCNAQIVWAASRNAKGRAR